MNSAVTEMEQLGNHNGFQLTSRIEYQDKDEFHFPFLLSLPFAPVAQLLNPQSYANPSKSRPFVVKLGGCTGIPFFIALNIGSVSAKLSGSELALLQTQLVTLDPQPSETCLSSRLCPRIQQSLWCVAWQHRLECFS